jgi:hypothetical protein
LRRLQDRRWHPLLRHYIARITNYRRKHWSQMAIKFLAEAFRIADPVKWCLRKGGDAPNVTTSNDGPVQTRLMPAPVCDTNESEDDDDSILMTTDDEMNHLVSSTPRRTPSNIYRRTLAIQTTPSVCGVSSLSRHGLLSSSAVIIDLENEALSSDVVSGYESEETESERENDDDTHTIMSRLSLDAATAVGAGIVGDRRPTLPDKSNGVIVISPVLTHMQQQMTPPSLLASIPPLSVSGKENRPSVQQRQSLKNSSSPSPSTRLEKHGALVGTPSSFINRIHHLPPSCHRPKSLTSSLSKPNTAITASPFRNEDKLR